MLLGGESFHFTVELKILEDMGQFTESKCRTELLPKRQTRATDGALALKRGQSERTCAVGVKHTPNFKELV